MRRKIRKTAGGTGVEMTWEEIFYFGFFILLSVTKGLGLYEGQKLFELLVFPAFWYPSSSASLCASPRVLAPQL